MSALQNQELTSCFCLKDGQHDILYSFWTEVTASLGEEFHRATEGKMRGASDL